MFKYTILKIENIICTRAIIRKTSWRTFPDKSINTITDVTTQWPEKEKTVEQWMGQLDYGRMSMSRTEYSQSFSILNR